MHQQELKVERIETDILGIHVRTYRASLIQDGDIIVAFGSDEEQAKRALERESQKQLF